MKRAPSLVHLVLVALAGAFYLLLSYLPLRGADLWGHVIYGEWILEHRSLPAEDPVMPLAAGIPVVDTAWLSQVALAGVEHAGGAEWLSRLFAVTILASVLLLGRSFFILAGSLPLAVLGTLAAVAIGWGRLTTFRPESFGLLAFAVLLWLITRAVAGELADPENEAAEAEAEAGRRPGRSAGAWRLWLGIPLLFVAWANLDGSFIYGLAVLGCCFLGRAIDAGWRRRSSRAAVDDPGARRWLYLTEIAFAATLVNPYGIDLLHHVLRSPVSPNLGHLPEWRPMVLSGLPGLAFALSWVVLLFVFRYSPRRMPVLHVLLLAVFATAAATAVGRMIWYGAVLAWVSMPHLAAVLALARAGSRQQPAWLARLGGAWRQLAGPSWRYAMLCATLATIVFILSPIGSQALGKVPRPLTQLFGEAPLELAGHLVANPPAGQVFNPAPWGDWLALQGPRGLRPFATTQIEWLPGRVWRGYQRIAGATSGWARILDGYAIDTVILSKGQQQALARAARFSEDWLLTYEDTQAMVFVRASTIEVAGPAGSAPAAPEPTAPALAATAGPDLTGSGG